MVRDHFMGIPCKDIDYSVVFENPHDFQNPDAAMLWFVDELERLEYSVVKQNPETFTIKAIFPKVHKYSGAADFVIARKETSYIPNTRTPLVEMGTLMDDLVRRDFTVNAMARDEGGKIVDPFNGQNDLIKQMLRTPTDAALAFNNDPLRILRAMRFHITKGLSLSDEIVTAIHLFPFWKMGVVSVDRIREEFTKMFKYDTRATLELLRWLNQTNPKLHDELIYGFWLMPTTKK